MGADVMVVDDDKEIADLVGVYLTNEGYTVRKCMDGAGALECLGERAPDIAVLDVTLPDMDGFALCRRIRADHRFPVIMLTARVEDIDKINGLAMGADDYVTKPFNPLELVARVKAQLRRHRVYNGTDPTDSDTIAFAGIRLDKRTHECVYNEVPVALTPTEFSILWLLCRNPGEVVGAERIFAEVWGDRYYGEGSNTVMVHVRHIREKLGEPTGSPRFLKTVWGVGYKVVE